MSRHIILSNGEMLVGLDAYGLVHDVYYPYIGQENHATARYIHHRIGVWVDDAFSWLDDDSWNITTTYEEATLIGRVIAYNPDLKVRIESCDFIDADDCVLARRYKVVNDANRPREIRLFLHQAFRISNSNMGGTAQYHPKDHLLVHYKGRRAFAIYAQTASGTAFDQYSVGLFGIEGKEGTYRDAEDGVLSCNPVEHGMVDSVMRLALKLQAGGDEEVQYWMAAARHPEAAITLHNEFKAEGFTARYAATKRSWKDWLHTSKPKMNAIPVKYRARAVQSLLLMKSHIDQRGGVLASADSEMLNYGRDYYGYCWPRDSVNVLWPLIKLGYTEEAKNFFEFCGRVRHSNGYLMHKYQMDGALGSSWHPYIHGDQPELPIQEDETAAVVFLVDQYHQYADEGDYVRELYDVLVRPAANFMTDYIDSETKLPHASFDLWEMVFGTHTYTVAITYAALEAASRMAKQYGSIKESKRWQRAADEIKAAASIHLWNDKRHYFYRSLRVGKDGISFDETIDIASLYGAVIFGLFDATDVRVTQALETAEATLRVDTPTGWGVVRFENDDYYRVDPETQGNPWIVTSLWLAKLHNILDDTATPQELVAWSASVMQRSGVLAEQIDPGTNACVSVAPLTWSQAEFVDTLLELS
ncbi:MAG TPA: glycoside hydrolase family 15 protein [Candidatus Saccharimonadia bacterium]